MLSSRYLYKLFTVILITHTFFINSGYTQTVNSKLYRDYFGYGLSAQDVRQLKFLDNIIIKKIRLNQSDYKKIVSFIQDSVSIDVVCHSLLVLSNQKNLPEFVVSELINLAHSENPSIKVQLSLTLGKLAIPRTFPVVYKFLSDYHCSGNAKAILFRFGLFSLIGLPNFLETISGGESKIPWIKSYFSNLAYYCIRLTGVGVFIPLVIQNDAGELFSSLEPIPKLEKIQSFLKERMTRNPTSLENENKSRFINFSLPAGKENVFCNKFHFSNSPIQTVIEELFAVLSLKVKFYQPIEGAFTGSFEKQPVGELLDSIFTDYSLRGVVINDKVLIFSLKGQPWENSNKGK